MIRFCTIFLMLSLSIISPAFGATYGLSENDVAPNFQMKDNSGSTFHLNEETKSNPVVLVFYRGGWCPYCSLQLRNLQKNVLPGLNKLKVKLVAISVDKPDQALRLQKKDSLEFTIISDPKAKLLDLYRVKYLVPDNLIKKYKEKLDAHIKEDSNGFIAVPAVFVIGQKNKIAYSYVNEDYKKRAPEKDILNAAQKAAESYKSNSQG